jgi:hypothetical protein
MEKRLNKKDRQLRYVLEFYKDVGVGDIMTWYGSLVIVLDRTDKGWRLKRMDTGKEFHVAVGPYVDLIALMDVFRFIQGDVNIEKKD